jgi:hypothetical protein
VRQPITGRTGAKLNVLKEEPGGTIGALAMPDIDENGVDRPPIPRALARARALDCIDTPVSLW